MPAYNPALPITMQNLPPIRWSRDPDDVEKTRQIMNRAAVVSLQKATGMSAAASQQRVTAGMQSAISASRNYTRAASNAAVANIRRGVPPARAIPQAMAANPRPTPARPAPRNIPPVMQSVAQSPNNPSTMNLLDKKQGFLSSLTSGLSGSLSFGKSQMLPIVAIIAVVAVLGFGVVKAATKKRKRR